MLSPLTERRIPSLAQPGNIYRYHVHGILSSFARLGHLFYRRLSLAEAKLAGGEHQ